MQSARNVPQRFIFAGGGTGGHLFPAIAIAQELKALVPGAEILFVGSSEKIESRVVPQYGFKFAPIWIAGFHRRKILANLMFPVKVLVGMSQAFGIVRKFKPDVVIGTGGYVSGPVVYAGVLQSIPTLIQDQNGAPGSTTKFLSSRVNEVHLTFASARKYLRRQDNIFLSGNPTRDALDNVDRNAAVEYFGFDPADRRKILLISGGSLGATSVNTAVLNNLQTLLSWNIRMIWQTGNSDYERIAAATGSYPAQTLCVRRFVDRMEYAYAASDAVLCRAGASTIAELTRTGKASILVPYPFAAANHQVENARAMVDAGAAVMVEDSAMAANLVPELSSLMSDDAKLTAMAERSKSLAKPDAGKNIAKHILALAERSARN